MRLIPLVILLIVASQNVLASQVVIDFESNFTVEGETGCVPPIEPFEYCNYGKLYSQGFVMDMPETWALEAVPGKLFSCHAYDYCSGSPAGAYSNLFFLEHELGQTFVLNSIYVDTTPGIPYSTGLEFLGTRADGSTIYATFDSDVLDGQTVAFSAEWSDLVSVQAWNVAGGDVVIDDITMSVVPVPAAVWLFGSALAGLGWFRRNQTA
jgi:hypothetical protein